MASAAAAIFSRVNCNFPFDIRTLYH
jgi:hypothetical protein